MNVKRSPIISLWAATVLLALAIIPAHASPASDSTVTYHDKVYAYSIEVPSNWIIQPTPEYGKGWGGVAQFTVLPPGKSLILQNTEIYWGKMGGLRVAIGILREPRQSSENLLDFVKAYERVLIDNPSGVWTPLTTETVTMPYIGTVARQSRKFMGIIDTTYYIPIGRWVMFVWRTPAESPWDADFTHMLHSLRFSAETETSIEKQRGSVGRGQRPQKKLSPEQVGIAAAWDQDPPGWDLPFLGGFAITQGPGCGETHQGWLYEAIDYGLPTDTVVQATDGGYVLFADWSGGFGNLVKIRHASDGFDSWYAHLSSYEVQPSHSVWQYQVIGRSGNTGYSTGPHLHFHALDIQSGSTHWIRTLPGTTWYSGSPYSPCDGGWANGG